MPTSSPPSLTYINNGGEAILSDGDTGSYWLLYIGDSDSETSRLTHTGGTLNGTADAYIGTFLDEVGSVSVTGGIWNNANQIFAGNYGQGIVEISGGAQVTTTFTHIGVQSTSNDSHIQVSGSGSIYTNTGDFFRVGTTDNSGNALVILDDGLVKLSSTSLDLKLEIFGTENFLRLDGGFFATFGNHFNDIESFIEGGNVQVWDGSAWVTSTNPLNFQFSYFNPEQGGEAEAFSGYSGLAGYTILTAQAIPEPATFALVLAAALPLLRRRRNP